MGEFFKPWRRQIGGAMLLMALAAMTGWFRSLNTVDTVFFPARLRTADSLTSMTMDRLSSAKNGITWLRVRQEFAKATNVPVNRGSPYPTWQSYSTTPTLSFDDSLVKWRWYLCGFGVQDDDDPEEGIWRRMVLIPYWMITVP